MTTRASTTTTRTDPVRPAPARDCGLCPRLHDFRNRHRHAEPEWFNAPVPSFGPARARLVVVGLAPGLRGANRTGRPFTGDFAGVLLYESLHALGLASHPGSTSAHDALTLHGVRITNAVKCVPPANKPTPAEARACRGFLGGEIALHREARVLFALGRIAHDSLLAALAVPRAACPFAHGAEHALPGGRWLVDSYHCSRYNTQTRRLTTAMFRGALGRAAVLAGLAPRKR